MKRFQTKAYFKVVMHSYELFGNYPCNQKHTKHFRNIFLGLYPKRLTHAPVSKFSVRMITSALNNGRSKIGVVNMPTPSE